jgi:glucuronate isomerase
MGCRVTDHALRYVMYAPATEAEIDAILQKALKGETITAEEGAKYRTAEMMFLMKEYNKRDLVCQIHFGCVRDNNADMYKKLGADTGFDAVDNYAPADQLAAFLNALSATDEIPKTILYSLNPCDNTTINTITGCFCKAPVQNRVTQGAAWWFNDHKQGMTDQLINYANLSTLGNFNGMLTDSRSFLSYTRHDYFRRILCNLVGTWVDNGEYPNDQKALAEIIKGISYNNAVRYFNFDLTLC